MAGKTNPFTLTFGKQPHRLVLRREKTEQIINDFTAEYSVSQIYLIEGIRGSGKTVLMTTVAKQLDEMLDEYVYRKIWSTLSGREQEIVSSMGEGVMKVGEVRQGVDMSSATFSQYREKMIAKGILNAPRYGYVELALPRFSEVAKTYRLT